MNLNKDFLKKLCNIPSPSGYENKAVDYFLRECSTELEPLLKKGNYVSIHSDAIGNGIVEFAHNDHPSVKIMISAHIDEIALQVQYIDDDGFIHFVKDGGIDAKVLPGSAVKILHDNSVTNGVIGKTPIHIEWDDESKDKVTKIDKLKIDCGFTSKDEAAKVVKIGNPIVIRGNQFEGPNDRIFSYGIDDKSGVWTIYEVLRKIVSEWDKIGDIGFYIVACTQEEVGADGAMVAAKAISPDISIDYDVTFATDDDNVKKEKYGDIKLGKGGCIAWGPDKNVRLCKLLTNVCEADKIPYQPFSVRNGGTDTEYIKLSSMNPLTETILLSIPQRNMHTQVEVCDAKDIASLVQMTMAAIHRISSGEYQILK